MKATMEGKGPDGFGWAFTFEWQKVSKYAGDIAQAAESFASFVSNTAGSAASADPTYVVTFSLTGPEIPEPFKKDKDKIEGVANDLQYSEMVSLQDAGLELLKQLNIPAHNEIKSGQRK